MRASIIALGALLAVPASAEPEERNPFIDARGLRQGANHHLGDDGFVAAHGRDPTATDEHARVQDHFRMIRQQLASRPATRPDLAARRAKILSYFDDYIHKDLTPQNTHLPWRTPVFIDDRGTICAVGYLIEQTAGRDLAESVAKSHRYDLLEDIAAAMPEVRNWVAESGLTLEELSSIQPGYEGPWIEQFVAWSQRDFKNGDYDHDLVSAHTHGAFRHHRMEGRWTITDDDTVVGVGELHSGGGTWKAMYDDGHVMAEGRIVKNYPSGTWKLYFDSGNLAATGQLRRGLRDGKWTFYYDTPAKTPIAIGGFVDGSIVGRWRHFDASGALLAESHPVTSGKWSNNLLTVVPGADRVEHQVSNTLDRYGLGGENLYVDKEGGIFDATGHKLAKDGDHWTAGPCGWSDARIRAAKRGDLNKLANLIRLNAEHDDGLCGVGDPVSAERGKQIDAILSPLEKIRAASPQFIRDLVLGQDDSDAAPNPEVDDLVKLIARHMTGYMEWPHIDKRFGQLYRRLPGLTNSYL
jgi:hypothetical protein